MTSDGVTAGLPRAATAEGQAGLDAIASGPAVALIASDYDGTLAPIVADPAAAYVHPGALAALRRLAARVGTLAVVTGRPVAQAVELGDLATVPGLIVLGHYGWERWEDGQVSTPAAPPGVAAARRELPGVLRAAAAPAGTRIEDKGHAVAVHTRGTADPDAALARLRGPLEALAGQTGLAVEPGRRVIELRPPGMDKGVALRELAAERGARSILFSGDDLGDLAAFAMVRDLRTTGIPGVTVISASPESELPTEEADLVVDGPDGIASLFAALADALEK
ncbi:MAG: trehalose-phosphatase [Streptosporangiaceae bacterium]|jgi:trehalose 6-phosphate phosphatase